MKVMIHIGLDVHNDSLAISLAPSDSTEVRRWGIIGGTHEHVQKFLKQIQAAHPDATLRFCYEAGARGGSLCRVPPGATPTARAGGGPRGTPRAPTCPSGRTNPPAPCCAAATRGGARSPAPAS